MKINEIKTKKELFKVADIWRERAFKLMDVCTNQSISDEKRRKAGRIWSELFNRLKEVMIIAGKDPKLPNSFKSGGHIFDGDGKLIPDIDISRYMERYL